MLHSDPRQSFVLATAGVIARGETEKLAMLDQYYAATTVLLEAVDKSRARSSCLQPVHVRNTGLLEAWERWPGAYARDCGPELEYRMRDPTFCFGENEYLFSQCLELDPILASVKRRGLEDEFKYSSIMVAAALLFWQRPHALIERTPEVYCQ